MPHKVPSFFNAPHSILPTYFQDPKKSPRSSQDNLIIGQHPSSITSASSQESEEQTLKMKRLSGLFKHGRRKSTSKGSEPLHIPAQLSITMESPPPIFHGHPSTSSGALISGQLKLYITEESMDITDYNLTFAMEKTQKRPFHGNCIDCKVRSHELKRFNFLTGPTTLKKGEHSYPFSFLLNGDLPAAIDGPLLKIQYNLHASITSKQGETITYNKSLPVSRSIFVSEIPKRSIRIFPPTVLTANMDLPSAIHPIGMANASMRLKGVVRRNEPEDTNSLTYNQWKLKRMTWRLEETHKVLSPACPKHNVARNAPRPGAEPLKRAHEHEEMRVVGSGELKNGWKGDYTSPTGEVELDFEFGVKNSANVTCDVSTEDGTEISHQLIVELIVAEEQANIKNPKLITSTGAARILRMHFNVPVTGHSGMGISWDEEQPPMYGDVPDSPPGYIFDYEGPPLPDYEPLPQ